MAELLDVLLDWDASDRVLTLTDLSELEPPSKKRKTGEFSSENEGLFCDSGSYRDAFMLRGDYGLECFTDFVCPLSSEIGGGVDDSRSSDDGWTSDDSLMELERPFSGKSSSENEGRLDDRRSNGGGLSSDNFVSMWVMWDWLYSNNKGGVNDSRSNGDGWMSDDPRELGQLALFPMELEPPFSGKSSSENEGRLDDRRSNDGGLSSDNFELMWSELCEITDLGDWLYSKNKGGVNDSRSNGDGWMPDDPHELGQPALVPMELEPPFSGKESNEISGVEGSCEVRSVAGKCPVRRPNAVQLLSASSNNSNYLHVNLRMEDRHPLRSWLSDGLSGSIPLPNVGIILGNLKPENVLKTDRSFRAQLAYIKKNNIDASLVKSTPEAEDLFSHLRKKNPSRLEAREVILHPFSWRSNVKLRFLRQMNARLLSKYPVPNPNLLTELQSKEPLIFYGNWIDKLDLIFKTYILQRKEKYDFSSVMELVRFMRNKSTHRDELPENIKELVEKGDEGFYNYFAPRFPGLFMKLYGAAFQFCREEEWFEVFRRENFPEYFESDAL